MTAIQATTPTRSRPLRFLRDTTLLTGRSLRAIPRVPERLLDVTIQPMIFILLFLYVFGSAIHQFWEQVLGMVIVVTFGLILGWNPHLTPTGAVELLALMVLAVFACTWCGVLLGMLFRSPDAMQGVGFIVMLPLAFLAGTFVPIAGVDAVPRAIAQWDPVSALVASVRGLTEGFHTAGSWQLDHPELAMALWCLLLLAICVPLALRRFNRTLAA